ncbi:MAG: CRISPR-associated ring nuclease Crn3/Csx3 [Nitrososphaerota archaeon]
MNEKIRFSLKTGKVQILEFTISGLLEPSDLRGAQLVEVDPSKPLIISGRGPQWLYAFLAHHYHFARILATYEPRANMGVVISSVNEKDVGLGVDIEAGLLKEVKLGADGRIDVGLIKLGSIQLLRAELLEGAFAEPSELKRIRWWDIKRAVDPSKPMIVYVMAPVWVSAKLAVEFSNLVPWISIYDPRLESSVTVARHSLNAPEMGQQVELKIQLK